MGNILKKDECLYGKSGLTFWPNSEYNLGICDHRTLHFAEKANEVTWFDNGIKDFSHDMDFR